MSVWCLFACLSVACPSVVSLVYVCLFVYLPVALHVGVCVCLSVSPFSCWRLCVCVCLFLCLLLSVFMPVGLPVCLSICRFVYLSTCRVICLLISLSVYLSVCLSILFLYVCLTVFFFHSSYFLQSDSSEHFIFVRQRCVTLLSYTIVIYIAICS